MGRGPVLATKWEIPSHFLFITVVVFSLLFFNTLFFFLFLQFLIVPCWRNITKDELRLPLSLSSQLTISTNWLILVICLGPEPSTYILRKISQEEKSRF